MTKQDNTVWIVSNGKVMQVGIELFDEHPVFCYTTSTKTKLYSLIDHSAREIYNDRPAAEQELMMNRLSNVQSNLVWLDEEDLTNLLLMFDTDQ